MENYFSSDPHFGHAGIIRLANRPFKNTDEMDKALVAGYNRRVKPDDRLFLLGDFGYRTSVEYLRHIRNQIKCRNIVFIWGNHDKELQADVKAHTEMFIENHIRTNIIIRGQGIVLDHFPILEWDHFFHGYWHLYGHVHGNNNHLPGMKAIDVGVDVHNYEPISFDEVADIIGKRANFNATKRTDYKK